MSERKKPNAVPVRAWALVDDTGYIYAATCAWTRCMTELHIRGGRTWLRAIRVEIRPVPVKRRKARRKKAK